MIRAHAIAVGCALALVVAAGAGATSQERAGGSTARAWAISVIVPGQAGAGTRVLAAPPGAIAVDGAFAYPADGSIVAARSVTTSVSATGGTSADADASSEVASLSLFGGEITAATVTGEAHARATANGGSGDVGTTGIARLVLLGHAVAPAANRQIRLGDWGYAITLEQRGEPATQPVPGYRGFVTALDVTLTAAHGGLPAGSELQIGHAEAYAQAGARAPLPAAPSSPAPPEPGATAIPPLLSAPPQVTPKLGESGYVFPVYGSSSFADTFGALRGDVSGGWHHGDDIFAPVGAPVLAVADALVFSVGWNAVGGWRLWLRDARGNEFYYAHLSAYSPLAVDGSVVRAGDVLGFVGDTGDAEGTPSHLHFEIHPVRLLGRGYDGAVDPTTYLDRWRRAPQDVRFEAADDQTASAQLSGTAPKPGAILLGQTDISTASGLDPRTLRRALTSSVTEGEGGPLLPRLQPPASQAPVRGAG
jgi:murein DD-endopeptidase MepM/ murein hydrolase activator NlpD